jgi:drug/metabolite transporter (DMT)-like permease
VIAVVLSLVASAMNATASVLQRRANREESDQRGSMLRMLLDLVRRPAWLGGIAAMVCGFVLEAGALTLGRIALVEPLMIAELPLTLVGAMFVLHRRYSWGVWSGIVGLAVGLAVFLFALGPDGGDPGGVRLSVWLVAGSINLGVAVVCVLSGWRWRRSRAALLGIGTGATFGLMSALISGAGAAYSHGGFALLFTSWQTYAAMVVGPTSFFLLQSALQAGQLVASQPGFTLVNPLASVFWGVLVFGETVRSGAWFIVALVAAAGVVVATLLLLRAAERPNSDTDSSGTGGSDTKDSDASTNPAVDEPERSPSERPHPVG